MASNSFGKLFRITTWGESHGPCIGVVLDGCPAGLSVTENEIRSALRARASGRTAYTSPRHEPEEARILSGIVDGKTTGAPICIMIPNADCASDKYEETHNLLQPGHANYTYLAKYGLFDHRGAGRASARETACRVAAGAIAKIFLASCDIHCVAYIGQIGDVRALLKTGDIKELTDRRSASILFCPDEVASKTMVQHLEKVIEDRDSVGGVVEFCTTPLPPGLGDPVYEKLDARLAYALMGIPGTKGVEIGSGFAAATMRGSEHNDLFMNSKRGVVTKTNHVGGILGGISDGMPLFGRVAFKPTPSIQKPMSTLSTDLKPAIFQLPEGSRHDPCIAIRAVFVVEAMIHLVLADALLMNRSAHL